MELQTQQPQPPAPPGAPGEWMPRPQPMPDCPPGLEYLAQVDQLLVKQQVELLEAFTGWETNNKYRVMNTMGQQCYYAFEKSSFCGRQCCGSRRGFKIHIVDNANNKVIKITRPFKCCGYGGCFACCLCCNHELVIEAPPGVPVGYVQSKCFCCSPSFVVLDESKDVVFDINGPKCMIKCCSDYKFKVTKSGSSEKVGMITKQWSGFAREAFTDADNFGVTFPRDLDPKMKACLMGALFLIDFMFFEDKESAADSILA